MAKVHVRARSLTVAIETSRRLRGVRDISEDRIHPYAADSNGDAQIGYGVSMEKNEGASMAYDFGTGKNDDAETDHVNVDSSDYAYKGYASMDENDDADTDSARGPGSSSGGVTDSETGGEHDVVADTIDVSSVDGRLTQTGRDGLKGDMGQLRNLRSYGGPAKGDRSEY